MKTRAPDGANKWTTFTHLSSSLPREIIKFQAHLGPNILFVFQMLFDAKPNICLAIVNSIFKNVSDLNRELPRWRNHWLLLQVPLPMLLCYQMKYVSHMAILIFTNSCKFILPAWFGFAFRFKLRPFRGVKTVCLFIDQLGGSSSSWGRGGVSGALPKLPQMHSFHLCWEQISAWNGRTGSSVLPVEEVHHKGEVMRHVDTI